MLKVWEMDRQRNEKVKKRKEKAIQIEGTRENKPLSMAGSVGGPAVMLSGTTKCHPCHQLCTLMEESLGFLKLSSLSKI